MNKIKIGEIELESSDSNFMELMNAILFLINNKDVNKEILKQKSRQMGYIR